MRLALRILLTLSLAGCGDAGSEQAPKAERQYGQLESVPAAFIGKWTYVGQECEPDSEETPDRSQRNITITFTSDFNYEMFIDGWRSVGKFRVDRYRDPPDRLQLADTMYEFSPVNGRLENWSEGEAVYLCGNIFERVES